MARRPGRSGARRQRLLRRLAAVEGSGEIRAGGGDGTDVVVCKRPHKWPRRWMYSKRRLFRTRFCSRCLEQDWEELRGKRYVKPDA